MQKFIVYRLVNKINCKMYFGYTKMNNSLSRQKELYRHNKELHNDIIKYRIG